MPRWKQGARVMTKSAAPLRVIEETPAYWRILFDHPPFNVADGAMFQALQDLLARMNVDPNLRVVVFESANHDFYLSHFDLTGKLGNVMTAVGPSGLPVLVDTFVRVARSPVVSIAKIRGCVRGACSEFVLACDMRFASRENTRLGQPEVGVGLHPGGGGTERLPHLVGRGRALEIILGANDFDGDTAERYGYVNRALPDAELDVFVDALARRIASFDPFSKIQTSSVPGPRCSARFLSLNHKIDPGAFRSSADAPPCLRALFSHIIQVASAIPRAISG